MKFILEHAKRSDADMACIFCDLQHVTAQSSHVLYRQSLAYVVLNIYPYNTGHLLIIPNRHCSELGDLSGAEHEVCGTLLAESIRILKENLAPHGFNIGMNLGRTAGAGIPDHLHYHVVPRWSGDTNFMPVVGDTRVLPESLESVYEKLAPSFEALVL